MGIKLTGRNVQGKIEKLTLGAVLIILDKVDQISFDTLAKIPKITLIKNNPEYLEFVKECEFVQEFRNDASHYTKETNSPQEKQIKLQRVLDKLEKILCDGLFLRVLK